MLTQPRADRWAGSGTGLVVVLMATFLAQFDFFVVNVAGPTIRADLAADGAALELIVGGYAFAYAAGLITAGRLGDSWGYRRMFVIGTVGFAVASLLCAWSRTPTELVAGRLLQGAMASVMVPQVFVHITAAVPASRRSHAIGWYAVTASIGSVAGQVLGGILVESAYGWRLIFLVNVPVALLAAAAGRVVLPATPSRSRARLDLLGAVCVTGTVAAALVPLTLGPARGWPAWTVWCLASAPMFAVVTVLVERHVVRGGGAPVVSTDLFGIPGYTAGLTTAAAFMLFFPSFMFTVTLLVQDGLGLRPLAAGLVFVPSAVTFAAGSLWARSLYARFGLVTPFAGCLLAAVGLGALAVSAMVGAVTAAGVSALGAVIGFGDGLVLPTVSAIALANVPGRLGGAASGLIESGKQFAGAAGVALIGTVYFHIVGSHRDPRGSLHGAGVAVLIDVGLVAVVAASLAVVRGANQVGSHA